MSETELSSLLGAGSDYNKSEPKNLKTPIAHLERSVYNFRRGDLKSALSDCEDAFIKSSQDNDKFIYGLSQAFKSRYQTDVGELENAQKSLRIAEKSRDDIKQGRNQQIFDILLLQSSVILRKRLGNLKYSLSSAEKALANVENIDDLQELVHYNLKVSLSVVKGDLLLQMGQIDDFEALMNDLTEPLDALDDLYFSGKVNRLIGRCKLYQQHNSSAISYFDKSSQQFEEINNGFENTITLFLKLKALTRENKIYDAEEIFIRIQGLSDKFNYKRMDLFRQLGHAILLINKKRRKYHVDAQRILESIITEGLIDYEILIDAALLLSDLLIEELSIYDNPEILEEVNLYASRLLELGKKQHAYSLVVDSTLLLSRIELVNFNPKKSREYLDDALQVAIEHGDSSLVSKTSNEIDRLLTNLKQWEGNEDRDDLSYAERVELAKLDGKLSTKFELTSIQGRASELPQMILIMSENGLTKFTYSFKTAKRSGTKEVDPSLVGSFISALNQFSQETFKSGMIERIKHQDHNMVFKSLDSILFCYIHKGQSPTAIEKLQRFMYQIRSDQDLWDEIRNEDLEIPEEDEQMVSIINSVF